MKCAHCEKPLYEYAVIGKDGKPYCSYECSLKAKQIIPERE